MNAVLLPPLGHPASIFARLPAAGVDYPLDELDLDAPDLLAHLADRLAPRLGVPWLLGGISLGATLCALLVERLPRPPRALLLMAPGGAPPATVRREAVLAAIDELGEAEFVRRHLGGDPTRAAATCALLRAALAADLTARLARLPGRIDVVWGTEDRLFNAAYIDRVRRALPPHHFHVLDGVGHLAAVEAPDRVAAILERAMKETT
jgi:pimeloyl-ACP methyl ester carboxylesterase